MPSLIAYAEELVQVYAPDVEDLPFWDAYFLAAQREDEAVENFLASIETERDHA